IEAAMTAGRALDGAPPSVGFVFASRDHLDSAEQVLEGLREATSVERMVGCVGEAVIGGRGEGGGGAAVEGIRWRLPRSVGTVPREGGVGVRLEGPMEIRTLVSQGCRPVGNSFVVTRAEENVVFELAGRPPLHRLRETVSALSAPDRELVSQGLHVGRVIDEYKSEFGQGDFLIRGVLGADPESGAIAVGDRMEVGETVQFHVREAASADEELRALLEREVRSLPRP